MRIKCCIRRSRAVRSGLNCNQVGAGPNQNNAAKLRRDIPVATIGEGADGVASETQRAFGLCLRPDAEDEGLAASEVDRHRHESHPGRCPSV